LDQFIASEIDIFLPLGITEIRRDCSSGFGRVEASYGKYSGSGTAETRSVYGKLTVNGSAA
jgi:hypothetical protein